MSKKRYIDTKFWSDSFVRDELNPLDRYLFLYFFTNERTNICWIYELPISIISFETWIEKENLLKMMERLKPKVYYIDWRVYIKNFQKHRLLRTRLGCIAAKKPLLKYKNDLAKQFMFLNHLSTFIRKNELKMISQKMRS